LFLCFVDKSNQCNTWCWKRQSKSSNIQFVSVYFSHVLQATLKALGKCCCVSYKEVTFLNNGLDKASAIEPKVLW